MMTRQMLQYLTGTPIDIKTESNLSGDEISAEEVMKCRDMNKDQNIFSYVYLVGVDCYNLTQSWCGNCYRTNTHNTKVIRENGSFNLIKVKNYSVKYFQTFIILKNSHYNHMFLGLLLQKSKKINS